MKKHFKIVCIMMSLVLAALMLAACSDHGAPVHSSAHPSYAVSEEKLVAELDAFMEANEDRTSYNDGERLTAIYLQERLTEMGYADVALQDFAVEETLPDRSTLRCNSQNVIAYYRTNAENKKNVVLGAYYDNRYGKAFNGATEYKSAGANANGTGVATLLSIADELINNGSAHEYGFDVTIVFFGASYVTDAGARAFYRDGMTAEERKNTLLMVELQRLACDHVYAFSDERETKREKFFDTVAAQNGLDIYKPTGKSPYITSAHALDGIPYFQWAQSGLYIPFFNAGIPTLNLIGGNWETIDMTDRESADGGNISYTQDDTLAVIKRDRPDYSKRMAEAATLVLAAMDREDFVSVMTYDKEHFPDTSALTKQWIWYLTVVCTLIIVGVAMMFACTHISKKYPYVRPQPARMKMAVFGMDYEDKSAADIFVDIKNPAEEIFPGIPNNEPKAPAGSLDDIFPPMFGGVTQGGEAKPNDGAEHTEPEAPEQPTSSQNAPEREDIKRDESESNEPTAGESEASAESTDGEATQNADNKEPPQNRPVEKKPPVKRKTVSAGKSASARKSTSAKKFDAEHTENKTDEEK